MKNLIKLSIFSILFGILCCKSQCEEIHTTATYCKYFDPILKVFRLKSEMCEEETTTTPTKISTTKVSDQNKILSTSSILNWFLFHRFGQMTLGQNSTYKI